MTTQGSSFLFRVWPYLALTLAAAGFAVRLLLTSDRVPALKATLARARRVGLTFGGWPWLAGWVALAAAHAAGLLFPRAILAWTRTPWHLYLLEAAGFTAGLAVLAACLRGAWAHLRQPGRDGWSLVADFADSVFLSFLFIAVASGLLAAGVHRWGSAWAAVTLAPYASSLVHGRPEPAFVAHLPLLVRLHVFAAFAVVAVLPASRLAVPLIVLAHRALAAARRGLAAAARPVGAWLRREAAARLWPDAEVRWLAKAAPDGPKLPAPRSAAWAKGLGRDGGAAGVQPRGKTV
jgi:nitrate reductase gamma subunit